MWTSFAAYIFKKRLFQLFHRHNNNNNIIYSYLSLSYHSQDITEAYTMKFICNKTEISEAIGNVSRAVSQKSTIPALEGIKVRVRDIGVEVERAAVLNASGYVALEHQVKGRVVAD